MSSTETRSKPLELFALGSLVISIFTLFWIAQTTTVWDDETNGYFLSRQPLPTLLELMAANVHEDPPLYDLLLHVWIKIADYDPLALRTLSLFFWGLALWGIFRAGNLLSGRIGAVTSLLVAVLMPYHWMFPAALRWYSFFAALSIWNMVFFVTWLQNRQNRHAGSSIPVWAGYVLTGTGMWYANYVAPAFFAAQLAAVISILWHDKKSLVSLAGAWTVIGILYLPWLLVFVKQLGESGQSFSLTSTLASLYVLWAGEFSTPLDWWISVPAGIVASTGMWIVVERWSKTKVPATIFVLVLLLLVAKNVIWTKRMLLVSPFFAVALGVALASSPNFASVHRWGAKLWVIAAAAALLMGGSLVRLFQRDGWISYRWLTPVADVVKAIDRNQVGVQILTNSNSVSFYAKDPVGLSISTIRPELVKDMKVLPFYPGMPVGVRQEISRRLSTIDGVVYLHESAGVGFSTIEDELTSTLAELGFVKRHIQPHAQASAGYLRYHPGFGGVVSALDSSRLIEVHFSRK